MEIPQEFQKNVFRALATLLVVLSAYFAMKLVSEVRAYGMMGSSGANTIVLSGHGEVNAVPDLATVYFTIEKDAKTVKEAQDAVALIEKNALDSLKANGIDEKDIKTANASFYPKYEYQYGRSTYYYPNPGKSIIVGYTASESITVKVRNVDNVGKVMQDLGTLGVSNLSGPNFTIDDEDALQAQARKMAIEDAKAKAKVLAHDLGVRLGRIVTYNEGGDYYPMPVMYSKALDGGAQPEASPAQVPKGENTISSDVTITYEIR